MKNTVSAEISTEKAPRRSPFKLTAVVFASLIGVLLLVVVVACYLVFTPSRLTSIVNKLSDRYLTCESHFERVDLSLFRTFPDVGLDIKDVVLVNPMECALSDTLARVNRLTVAINVKDYLKNKDINVEKLLLKGVVAHVFVNKQGEANYDIFVTDTTQQTDDTSSSSMPDRISLKKIHVDDLSCDYRDLQNGVDAVVDRMDVKIDGEWMDSRTDAVFHLQSDRLSCVLADSVGLEMLNAHLDKLKLKLTADGPLSMLRGSLDAVVADGDVRLGTMDYVTPAAHASRKHLLEVELPFEANVEAKEVSLSDAVVSFLNNSIVLSGHVALPSEYRPLTIDTHFSLEDWHIVPLLDVLPSDFTSWREGMDLDGCISVYGTAVGALNDTSMPLVEAHLKLADGVFALSSSLPYRFNDIASDIDATLNLNKHGVSKATVNSLRAVTGKNCLELSGKVDDLLGAMNIDARLKGDVALKDVKPILPDSLDLDMKGRSHIDMKAAGTLAQFATVDLAHLKVDGIVRLADLNVRLDDIMAQSPNLSVAVKIPSKDMTRQFDELLSAHITSGSLHAVVPTVGVDAHLTATDIDAAISDVLDPNIPFSLAAKGTFGKIEGRVDTIQASISEPRIEVEMVPKKKEPSRVDYKLKYNSSSLFARINDSLSLNMAGLEIKGTAHYDSTRSNVLQQWSPDFDVDFKRGYINMTQLDYIVQVPDMKFNYKPERCEISSANVVFGNSDFYLSGAVTGLEDWISHEDMLRGDLYFTSNYTNVDDLMAALSGLGTPSDSLSAQQAEVPVSAVRTDPNPFIVPRDVDFVLHTRIKECTAFDNELQELAGDVMVHDGVAVLEQVGFVCKAARMQLTALYRTPRINHIFVGMDFHLLDINISELIDMIPCVDTLVPMLAAFDGHADFHLCAETYVDAYYQPKMSTLRGAAALSGDHLVVLDNETFNTIAKYMMFSKRTENVVDSLNVEMTVFRKEVEIYPFLLSMDKYRLVASGRHNLDMNYDYHLEILKSPLPSRLALDVKGVMPKLGFSLTKCRYPDLFEPEKQSQLESQTMRLKNMIRESLEKNVKESTREYKGL